MLSAEAVDVLRALFMAGERRKEIDGEQTGSFATGSRPGIDGLWPISPPFMVKSRLRTCRSPETPCTLPFDVTFDSLLGVLNSGRYC